MGIGFAENCMLIRSPLHKDTEARYGRRLNIYSSCADMRRLSLSLSLSQPLAKYIDIAGLARSIPPGINLRWEWINLGSATREAVRTIHIGKGDVGDVLANHNKHTGQYIRRLTVEGHLTREKNEHARS
jgi:hypothetical protein